MGFVFNGHIGKPVWKASSLHSCGGLFVIHLINKNMSLILTPIGQEIREKKWLIPSREDSLVCSYKYFRIFTSDLGFAYNLRWSLSSDPSRDITEEQIKQYFPSNQPRLGIWEHYALFIIFGPIILLVIFGH